MPANSEKASGRIEVAAATRDQVSTMANLLELYAHDFSEFHHLELGANGRFGYPRLASYWSEPNHHPFLLKVDAELAGLVLVRKGLDGTGVWDMAEFFIVRGYRRRGIGMKVAHEVWRRLPGPWAVRVMESNGTALRFWERAIATFCGEGIGPVRVEKDGEFWQVFAFECRGASICNNLRSGAL